MKLQPRSYQIESVKALYDYFHSNGGNPLVVMPTGTGKSVCIAMFLESIFENYPSQRVIVLTHVKELIVQNYNKLLSLWPTAPAGIHSSGLKRADIHNSIIFAGIASVAKKWAKFGKIDLIIIDEAHLLSPSENTMYQVFIAGLMSVNPNLKVVGFTATPWRLGQGLLTENGIFTDIAFDISGVTAFNRLIHEGYLAPLIPKRTKMVLNVDTVPVRGGEFGASELQLAVDKNSITAMAIEETMAIASDRKCWLVFCSGVEHAEHVADMLNEYGIKSAAVHSKMPDNERDAMIADFKAGKITALTNAQVMTTGHDIPQLDLIVMLRPTQSTVLWVQMIGRGTRVHPGKENCMVLDFAGNTARLGPINDPVIPRKKGDKPGKPPVKVCDTCDTINHISARFCISCNTEFTFKSNLEAAASTVDIIKQDLPIVEMFEVSHITYSAHHKTGAPTSLKVSYYCGYQMFNEYIGFEHGMRFVREKASKWWRERSKFPVPESVERVLIEAKELKTPTHIKVWINKKWPEIMGYDFEGTSFGLKEAKDSDSGPKITVEGAPENYDYEILDEIPF